VTRPAAKQELDHIQTACLPRPRHSTTVVIVGAADTRLPVDSRPVRSDSLAGKSPSCGEPGLKA
jgi:hypothetical protein